MKSILRYPVREFARLLLEVLCQTSPTPSSWTHPRNRAGAGSPIIELNGNNAGTLRDGLVLASGSSGSTIRGFIINRFTGDGIEINSSNSNVIEGNWIGLSNPGTSASANALRGLYAINSAGNTIGGTSTASRNVIAGNTQQGIYFDNIDTSFVYGNYIGTNAAGTADINGSTANTAQTGIVMLNGSSGNQIGNTIAGARNVISGNNHYGAEVQGATSQNNTVSGNYIGTNYTGLAALGNTNGGFSFWGSGTGNSFVANVVAGNLGQGVLVGSAASGSKIQGNYIGVGLDGSTIIANGAAGISVEGASINTLIGTDANGTNDAAEANTISGNSDGIIIDGVGTTGTMVYGNFIGTDASGLLDRGNTFDGVRIQAGATTNYIGGATSTRRNIIAGNNQDGIEISGETSDGNFIQNNYIGLGTDGTTVIGNSAAGITITGGADNTTIGGISLGNVIVGNGYNGIEINGASSGTTIYGNTIGINAAGTVVAGNQYHGIQLINGVSSTTIGGTTAGQGNTITANGVGGTYTNGINLWATGTGNSMVGNSIYGNAGIGIDVDSGGVTANDNLDADTGSNNQQNFPVLSGAVTDGVGTVLLSGSLNTLVSITGLVIHFYATPAGTVNDRQGKRYLGSTGSLTSDASGNTSFSDYSLSAVVTSGEIITATATYTNNTSEFSLGFVATALNSAPVLDSTKSPAFNATLEDGGSPAGLVGTLVSALVDFSSPSGQVDNITDSNSSPVTGIAVTSADVTSGTWWYSINNGTNWNALGVVSNSAARLLAADANTRLYFQPNANFNGNLSNAITFRAWDQTSGSNGGQIALPTSAADVLDSFGSASFSNNNGSVSWSGSWIESDAGGSGAAVGDIDITSGYMRFRPVSVGNSIARQVNLSNSSSATFSFSMPLNSLGSGQVQVQVSSNGGSNWTTLQTITSATPTGSLSYDISSYMSSNTQIRFYGSIASTTGIRIDDVRIQHTIIGGGTTAFSTATDTAAITVTAVNDAPVLTPYAPALPLTEDSAAYTATVASLLGASMADIDSGAVQGIAVTNIIGSIGMLEYSLNGTTWTTVSSVSANNALLLRSTDSLRFTPNGQTGGSMSMAYRAWDQSTGSAGSTGDTTTNGGTTAFSSATDTVTVTTTSINDAPVLDNTGTMTLTSITEDDTNNAGQTVASIIASAVGDRITDVDSAAVEGIAITSLNSGYGKWQYSTDGGSNWLDVGAVSNTSALLLRSNDFVRFLPQYENGSTPDFTFRAWDQTSGTAGTKVTTASNGGTFAFSSATETASIVVTDVNDAPVLFMLDRLRF
jgi:hypothetical protein